MALGVGNTKKAFSQRRATSNRSVIQDEATSNIDEMSATKGGFGREAYVLEGEEACHVHDGRGDCRGCGVCDGCGGCSGCGGCRCGGRRDRRAPAMIEVVRCEAVDKCVQRIHDDVPIDPRRASISGAVVTNHEDDERQAEFDQVRGKDLMI